MSYYKKTLRLKPRQLQPGLKIRTLFGDQQKAVWHLSIGTALSLQTPMLAQQYPM